MRGKGNQTQNPKRNPNSNSKHDYNTTTTRKRNQSRWQSQLRLLLLFLTTTATTARRQEMFRLQKLLLSEYSEIYEPLMVESPFTLVDANGRGLRQYQIGLSSSMLLFGSDNFDKQGVEQCGDPNFQCEDQDAEIECFDLISLVPLQYARFNFYRKNDRYIMMLSVPLPKHQQPADHPMTFEFGGHIHKNYYFQTWRERVACIRTFLPRFSHINGASPFSSTDIQVDDVQHIAQVHVKHRPQSVYSMCYSSAGGA